MTKIDDFALVIGAMKCGTTSLYDHLVTHPQIARCVRKESNFFSSRAYAQGPDHYYSLWKDFDPAVHAYALEASTDYTKQPRHAAVPARIAAFGARFRFLYILRDPVDRIESHVAHNIARGRTSLTGYAAWIDAAVDVSSYARQLDIFRAALGDAPTLLLDFDRLRRDPAGLLADCVRFLDLDDFTFSLKPPSNTRPAMNDSEMFRLTPEQRLELQGRLYDDVMRLRDRHGFDISGWNFRAAAPARSRRSAPAVATADATPARRRRRAAAQSGRDGYWTKRRDMMYYKYVLAVAEPLAGSARSLIDVGSNRTSIAEAFDWIPRRHALDLRRPYSSEQVEGICADFFEFEPEERYDFALCLQVLEHVPDAARFARRLLAVADRVLVSVPYKWPKGACTFHCQDPVNEAKLAGWFGRKPDYQIVVDEPFQKRGRRLIAYFHTPGVVFRPKDHRHRKGKLGKRQSATIGTAVEASVA